MSASRRDILKAAGITLLGVSGAAPIIARNAKAASVVPAPPQSKGKSYAMAVDAAKCVNCPNSTACIDACHLSHNVPDWNDPEKDPEEEVKWMWTEHLAEVFPEQVNEYSTDELKHRKTLVFCNHCDNPSCVKVCPTKATFKREDGPVMMDMHRCIGCRYCIVGCPYGARSFNWKSPRKYFDEHGGPTNPNYPERSKGVVEKCTMCTERIAENKVPFCVEACQTQGSGALIFGDLQDPNSEIRKLAESRLSIRRRVDTGNRPQVFYTL